MDYTRSAERRKPNAWAGARPGRSRQLRLQSELRDLLFVELDAEAGAVGDG